MAQVDFENLLKQTMGLDATSIGSSTIERAVRFRMAAAGLERTDDYWRRLNESSDELQELIETVVVPETWFFRDREAFSALVRLVTEKWHPSHPTSVLRLLSIPCSTGEEPYSMVMALLDAGIDPERFCVEAVDISSQALARAKRGTYGNNSFRGENLDFRERYFEPTVHGHKLVDRVVQRVKFRQGNLLSDAFRPELYDVIFCRNLLIYFDRPTQEQAMRTLRSWLADCGFLFVGPAEAFLASCSGFGAETLAMAFAFRKTEKQRAQPEPQSRSAVKPLWRQTQLPMQASSKRDRSPVFAPVLALAPETSLKTAQSLADAGKLREAVECCENHLRQHGLAPEAFYLLGLLRDAMGDRQGAADSYRKVLYLDPEHVQALLHLALLIERQGDTAAAERFRERARRTEASRRDGTS